MLQFFEMCEYMVCALHVPTSRHFTSSVHLICACKQVILMHRSTLSSVILTTQGISHLVHEEGKVKLW